MAVKTDESKKEKTIDESTETKKVDLKSIKKRKKGIDETIQTTVDSFTISEEDSFTAEIQGAFLANVQEVSEKKSKNKEEEEKEEKSSSKKKNSKEKPLEPKHLEPKERKKQPMGVKEQKVTEEKKINQTHSMKEAGGELTRQQIRRRRRIRNQTICITVLIFVIGSVSFLGLWGTKQIINGFKTNHYNINSGITMDHQETENSLTVETVVIETETVEEVEETYVRDELDDLVDTYLADMTLEEKIAQMFIITPEMLTNIPGPATVAGSKTEAALQEIAIGGVLFQKSNFNNSQKAKDMVTKTFALAQRPLFTSVFEAGGGTGTLSSNSALSVTKTKKFSEIGEANDGAAAYDAGEAVGTYLKDYGFTLDLSVVCDLNSEESFGSDPMVVADCVTNYVKGLRSTGVHACLSHFPGTSSLTEGSSGGVRYTELTLDELRNTDFIPFKAGIEAGAEFVMVGHIADANITGDSTSASLSSVFITDLLRGELGFKGVVMTDRMDVPAITNYWTTQEATLMAVFAGADIILCPDDYQVAYNALISAVNEGTISEERINESLHRIYRVKFSDSMAE